MRNPARRLVLNVESLEHRYCPVVAVAVVDQTIIINSDNEGDIVRVAFNAAGLVSVFVDANRDGDFADAGETLVNAANNGDTIVFNGRGGDDVLDVIVAGIRPNGLTLRANLGDGHDAAFVTIDNAGAVNLASGLSLNLTIDGGRGNDVIGFTGNLTINEPPAGGALLLQFRGGRGDDQISALVLGTQQGGHRFPSVAARLSGGAGDDEISIEVRGNNFGNPNEGDRSKIVARLDGDAGSDRLTGLLVPDPAAPNSRKARGVRVLDGGDGTDRVTTLGFRAVNFEKGK